MPGSFVISLDFELMWGMRDRPYASNYNDAILGGRLAVPQMLTRFSRHGVRATWATVGLLFARTRAEMLCYLPTRRPNFRKASQSPYAALFREVGANEAADPYHFGGDLIRRIADTPGQEIATHGFAHVPSLSPEVSLSAFEADLEAAVAISSDKGFVPRSMVFPRDQMSDLHVAICARQGITAFRGLPAPRLYHFQHQESRKRRVLRHLDGVLPLVDTSGRARPGACTDVPASRMLRPARPMYTGLHLRRIKAEMRAAAMTDGIYHLWWHPHNFGRKTAANLAQLDEILAEFERLRDSHGMVSQCMDDFADRGQTTSVPRLRVIAPPKTSSAPSREKVLPL